MSKQQESKSKIALLAGGTSGEREVSLASGKGASEALIAAGYSVTMLDPANKADLHTLIDGDFDVAFIALHGKNGEDGTIQGFLEVIGLPYVGSGVWSSSLAMDKAMSKIFYDHADILTPDSVLLKENSSENLSLAIEKIGAPCVVKPSCEGSALGVFIVKEEESLSEALNQAFAIGNEVLVEKYITGRELTVAVLGNNAPEALPVIEIIPSNDFYDYESKYAPGGSQHICPAKISDSITEKAQKMAVMAHQVLGCRGMSRSDFIVDGQDEVWILETNTIPGMTETSLLPDAGRAANMDFSELCCRLIDYALEDTARFQAENKCGN